MPQIVESRKVVRCAIYTRKSTEDGLERDYNCLDAQYDACAAYALSQRHEGWTVVSERYDVVDRKLIPNTTEAQTVRHLMGRYVALNSVKAMVAELARDGYRTKVQIRTSAGNKGGCLFRRGTLYHLLANRIYWGEIVHKGVGHTGEHEPIVPIELWDQIATCAGSKKPGRNVKAWHQASESFGSTGARWRRPIDDAVLHLERQQTLPLLCDAAR